jgi:hypothetical protein
MLSNAQLFSLMKLLYLGIKNASKKEHKISQKIVLDFIKHIFAIKIDNQLIPMPLSGIQKEFYDALS